MKLRWRKHVTAIFFAPLFVFGKLSVSAGPLSVESISQPAITSQTCRRILFQAAGSERTILRSKEKN